ncbi:MAG: FAD/NAD(P)-binding protein [Acidimicrobiia bacterium]|nr:FAD/NAD(P)-binding protein [Acidimicrobiia bacterium]
MIAPAGSTASTMSSTIDPLLIPRPYRVVDKVAEVADITSLHVVPVDGGSLPPFRPAQVGMLGAFGFGEAAISISSAVTCTDYHAYTIRRAGPISGALVDTPIGGVITVRGPFGQPWPLDDLDTGTLLIIGGGLGIAPLRAAIEEAVDRMRPEGRVVVVYGAKRPDLLVYGADLDRWRKRGAEVALIVDGVDDDSDWSGPVGVVPDLLGSPQGVNLDWSDTTAFVCGPDVMMHFSRLALEKLGVPGDRIWFTLERNMQCGNALCGHCQLGPFIVCRDGPVVRSDRIARFHSIRDL